MIEKPEDLFLGYVAQKAIIEVDDKILFVKSVSDSTRWDLPGGRLHINEHPETGLLRELKEELGVVCKNAGIVAVNQFKHHTDDRKFYLVTFAATMQDKTQEIVIAEDELSEFAWLSKDEITVESTYEVYLDAIEKYFAKS